MVLTCKWIRPDGHPYVHVDSWGGDVVQFVEHQTGTLPMQVRFPGAARDFSPRVHFQCRLSHGARTPCCGITCINICAHVKDPVVHVRVWWIMKTLKHPACTIGWVAQLLEQAFLRKSNLNFPWKKSQWDNTVVKKNAEGALCQEPRTVKDSLF